MILKFKTLFIFILTIFQLLVNLKAKILNFSNTWTSQVEIEEESFSPSPRFNIIDKKNFGIAKTVIISGIDSVQVKSKCKNNSSLNDPTKIIIQPENKRIRKIKLIYIGKNKKNRTLEIFPHFDNDNFTPDLIQINIVRSNKSFSKKIENWFPKFSYQKKYKNESESTPINIITGGNETCAKYIININDHVGATKILPSFLDSKLSVFKSSRFKKLPIETKKPFKFISTTLTKSSITSPSEYLSSFTPNILVKFKKRTKQKKLYLPSTKSKFETLGELITEKLPKKMSSFKPEIKEVTKSRLENFTKMYHTNVPHYHHHHHHYHHHYYHHHHPNVHSYRVRKKYTHISLTSNEPSKVASTTVSNSVLSSAIPFIAWKKHKTMSTHKYNSSFIKIKPKHRLNFSKEKSQLKKYIDRFSHYQNKNNNTKTSKNETKEVHVFHLVNQNDITTSKFEKEFNQKINPKIDKLFENLKKNEKVKVTEKNIKLSQTETTLQNEDVMEIHNDHSPFFFFLLNLQGYKVENGHLVDVKEKGSAFRALKHFFKHKNHKKKN